MTRSDLAEWCVNVTEKRTSPNVIGTDGVERTWAETFVVDFRSIRTDADCIGYVVRRTFFDGRAHEDVERFDMEPEFLTGELYYTEAYGLALECAHKVRSANDSGYAVIDRVYKGELRLHG